MHLNFSFFTFGYAFKAYIGEKEADLCLKITAENDLGEFTRELLWQKVFSFTRLVVVPEFWSKFAIGGNEVERFEKFSLAVTKVGGQVKELQSYFVLLDRLARNASPLTYELYKTNLGSMLLSKIPKDFESIILSFYSKCFRAFNNQDKLTESPTGLFLVKGITFVLLNNLFYKNRTR